MIELLIDCLLMFSVYEVVCLIVLFVRIVVRWIVLLYRCCMLSVRYVVMFVLRSLICVSNPM